MKVSLFFCQGNSDKEYHIQLEEVSGGYVVNFQYGRRGGTLNSGTKTESAVSKEDAQKIYDRLLKEKNGKGYIEGDTKNTSVILVSKKESSEILPQLLNPIENPETYISDDSFLAQEKFDGERRIVSKNDEEIKQYNRKGKLIPTITNLKSAIKCDCILDGEMVGEEFYIFDLLSLKGKDLRNLKCSDRISLLNEISFGKGVTVIKTFNNTKEKKKLYEQLKKDNREGIVFKKKDAVYLAGRPSSFGDFLKFKFYKTATFIVSNITKGKRSVGLELIGSGDERVFMGKVTIPPNHEVPSKGDLVEVRYLYAYKDGAIFQPTYLGKRTDLDAKDLTIDQIVYKCGEEDDA